MVFGTDYTLVSNVIKKVTGLRKQFNQFYGEWSEQVRAAKREGKEGRLSTDAFKKIDYKFDELEDHAKPLQARFPSTTSENNGAKNVIILNLVKAARKRFTEENMTVKDAGEEFDNLVNSIAMQLKDIVNSSKTLSNKRAELIANININLS